MKILRMIGIIISGLFALLFWANPATDIQLGFAVVLTVMTITQVASLKDHA